MDNSFYKSLRLSKQNASHSTSIADRHPINSCISRLLSSPITESYSKSSYTPSSGITSSTYKYLPSNLRLSSLSTVYQHNCLPNREESSFEPTNRSCLNTDNYFSKKEDIYPESTFQHTRHTNVFSSSREETSHTTSRHQEEILRKLENSEKNYEELKIQSISINAVLDETLKRNKELTSLNLLLRNDNEELKTQVAKLPIEPDFANSNLEETLINLQIENNNLKKSLTEMENMLEKKSAAIKTVRDKYKSIQENSVSLEEATILKNHITALKKQLESSKDEIYQLNISNRNKNTELELSQRERRILEAEIANMKLLRLSTKSLPMTLTPHRLEDEALNSIEISIEQIDDFNKFPTWWRSHMADNHITYNDG